MTDKPSLIVLRHDHRLAGAQRAEHRQGARLGARRRRGRRHQGGPRLRPGADLRGRPPTCSRTPARLVRARQGRARPSGTSSFDAWAAGRPGREPPCSTGCRRRTPARRLGRRAADVRAPTRRASRPATASGEVLNAIAAGAARAVGRLGRPGRVQQHHHRGRARRSCPTERADRRVDGRPLRPGAALRHPRARHGRDHERHRRSHGGTRVFGGTFLIFSDYMRGAVRLAALMRAAGHLRLDPRLRSASARTARPTSRSSTSPRCARSPASTSSARPTPTRPPPAGTPILEHTDRPAGLRADPPERAGLPARRGRLRRHHATCARGGYVLLDAEGGDARRRS